MKVYVDELPKSCGDCVFCKQTEYYYYCDKLHTKLGYINKEKDCALQSLSDYTKQVRKEVIRNLKQEIIYYPVGLLGIDGKSHKNTLGISKEILESYFEKILDQIQGE